MRMYSKHSLLLNTLIFRSLDPGNSGITLYPNIFLTSLRVNSCLRYLGQFCFMPSSVFINASSFYVQNLPILHSHLYGHLSLFMFVHNTYHHLIYCIFIPYIFIVCLLILDVNYMVNNLSFKLIAMSRQMSDILQRPKTIS